MYSSMATQNGTKIEQSSFEQTKRPSKAEATIEARNFVFTNSYATMNTIHQQGQFEGFPTGQVEYYADTNSDDASLLMIRVDMSSSFNNIKAGSPLSLSIRTGDSPNAHAPEQMASSKRIVLYGRIQSTEPSEEEKSLYFKLHPDALAWEPGKPGWHFTDWVKFVPEGIYYIGGFGDKHFIGTLAVDKYTEAPIIPSNTTKQDSIVKVLRNILPF